MTYIHKIQKHFQNVMLVGMAGEISENKCVDRLRHYGIKGVKAKINVHTNQILDSTPAASSGIVNLVHIYNLTIASS